MLTISDKQALREQLVEWHQAGDSVALVPTMGNLHKGHMSLVQLAAEQAERVVVSVFVNPTQFGEGEDFASYPRTPDKDARQLNRAGVDILFTPSVEDIYPLGFDGATRVSVPALAGTLCGENRPGHFDGVASVVLRLLNIVYPNVAIFGAKDYQQFVILQRMAEELHLHTKLLVGPTFRDDTGLAMSSRNQYLTDAEMLTAPLLYATLAEARDKLIAGDVDIRALEGEAKKQLAAAGFKPDYFSVRRADSLIEAESSSGNLVIMAAAVLGKARLIDNLSLNN